MKQQYSSKGKISPVPITRKTPLTALIDQTFLAYNAGRLREACQLFAQKMLREDVVVGLSITGALTPAGVGVSCLIPLLKHGLIDWIVSTGANLYHDLHFSLGMDLYQGSPFYDDTVLKKQKIVRIYDIIFDYDVLTKTDAFIKKILTAPLFQREMSSAELHYFLGKYCYERERIFGGVEKSVLATAYKYRVPIYTSSPGDSSIGMNIACLELEGHSIKMNPMRDVNETAAIVYHAKRRKMKSGVLLLGGGSPKNFILQTEPHIQEILGLEESGHDYFIQITDARPDTGGLSGATPGEAVSWGKINPGSLPDTVVVYADTTIALPLLTAYALGCGAKRKHKKLYNKRDELLLEMKRDAKAVLKNG